MPITVADLKFFAAERMTDNADGGGQMTATEIVSGASNQIFDDLSDVDRAAGDVSLRKVYAAVTSPDTDKYLDAGVVIFAEPDDTHVSVLAFSTGSFYDERAALKSRLEQTISRGPRYNGWLYGPHLTGQRALLIWQRVEAALPSANGRLEIVAKSGSVESYSQFVWITRFTEEIRTMYEVVGGATVEYWVRVLTLEIAEPLAANYTGNEPSRGDPSVSGATALIYDTRYNAEAVPVFGIQPLTEDAALGDYTVKAASLYCPLIPTAFAETALPDVTPGGDSPALIAGRTGTVSFTTATQSIKPDASLYLGTGVTPGTLTITVSGATLTDDNGALKLAGTAVGTIDYGNGVCRWNSSCPNYSTSTKTITFTPAARPLRIADTAAQAVTVENRGFVWVITLSPVPAPGTLRVSYRVNDQWYTLTDQGGGVLSGADSSYGAGSLNFTTGTVTLSTGALPDVDSEILYAWGTPTNYTARGGTAVDPARVTGTTAHAPVAPNTFSVQWLDSGSVSRTLTDDGDGNLTGTGGSGTIRYQTGEWSVRPTLLPNGGTTFTVDYDYGTPYTETLDVDPVAGTVTLSLAHTNLTPGSVDVEFAYAGAYGSGGGTAILTDDGAGNLTGAISGTVNYSTGTITLPSVSVTARRPVYTWTQVGTRSYPTLGTTYPIYRSIITGWENYSYGPVGTGTVYTVHYRTSDSPTAVTGETTVASQLALDLTRGFQETIVPGSVRFKLGTELFVDTAGQIYRSPGFDTGAGTLCGSLDPSSGVVRLSSWTAGLSNTVTLESLVTDLSYQTVDEAVFRAPTSPLKAGTLQLRYTQANGTVKDKTVDATGVLEDSDCTITVDYPRGTIRARFGLWKVDAALTPEEKLEPWYDPDHRVDFSGTLKIWKPVDVLAGSIVYNAVAQTFLPPDSALLGLNAARLPPDGKALIFNVGRLALIHHTDHVTESALSPTEVVDCGRVRLYRAVIEDVDNQRLPPSFYTVDRELGTVTMSPTLDLTGYTGPYRIIHTIADLARIVSVDINGTIGLNQPVTHAFPADESRVSGVLFIGTLQARYTNLFAQSTWDGVWQDTLRGSAPLANYNDTLYPVVVSNLGAYPDRFLIKFTSASAFQVIGENLGLIATGNISVNCAPVNGLTGQPYFTLDYRGWGSGWATGNCLRFNLVGAAYPIDLVRAVQPSAPTGGDDSVELLFIGNVDAE